MSSKIQKSNKVKKVSNKKPNATTVALSQQHYSGPIPRPADLEKYEHIQVGFADRIITMAEKESQHRIKSENKIINSERIFNIIGQLLATILGLGVIGVMVYAFYLGYAKQVQYIVLGIASVVGLFIYRRNK